VFVGVDVLVCDKVGEIVLVGVGVTTEQA